ncbi:hypothetical protein FLA105534_02941 [Flavobacterium bizetiae]|uniref:Uncharacterized protein n=2 Tax=Flavobacterium bizetiae TaxID=2704140 RepID=A0A6J4GR84_9FLAO|nr:hypothetical protein [Flavobacterium bizetiae]CAA9200045.1 hypothetical protein FLA105534_02941 [Flavobacterium bizetiae]CAD5343478.1 hypothetical protein FLA105535_03476 [Flavobacterium bizetiae]CAD5349471.1 hypothetical protein FLA105534_03455 [Flavobacterium bizetiae]
MKITIALSVLFLSFTTTMFSQTLADLKLKNKEIPKGYTFNDGNICVTPQACNFYTDIETYSNIVGIVKSKQIQSFKNKADSGSIMYFEFEHTFKGDRFLQGLLWGKDGQPTDERPEEYLAKGKFLIIWSFHPDSKIKEKSEAKIEALLQ